MDFMSPSTFDILNIQTWKVKMSLYLKALGIYVYFATTRDSYCLNGKNIEANAKAISPSFDNNKTYIVMLLTILYNKVSS